MSAFGWVTGTLPRMFTVQADGCAPMVRAFHAGAPECTAWENPWTVASGLRVPGPLGDRLMLEALHQSGGGAVAVTDEALLREAARASAREGIDFAPEGGAALAAAIHLMETKVVSPNDQILLFNTGAGWLYR